MNKSYTLILLIFIAVIASCGFSTDGGGFRTSDKEFTELLYKELDKNNIKYTVSQEGYIYYDEPAKKGFLKAQKHVERFLYHGAIHKMETTKERDYFVSLLKEKNIEHYLVNKDNNIWVKWFPDNDEQQLDILGQLVNYKFDNRRNNTKSN